LAAAAAVAQVPPNPPSAAPVASALHPAVLPPDLVHHLTEPMLRRLRAKFRKYDHDNSGAIEQAELHDLLRELGFRLTKRRVRMLSEQLDADGSTEVSYAELVVWYDSMVVEAVERMERRQRGWRKHAAALGRALTIPPWAKVALAWLAMWGAFTAMAMVSITLSLLIGQEQTRLMLFSWTLAETQTLCVEEPLIIALSAILPFIMDRLTSNPLVAEVVESLFSHSIGACISMAKGLAS
jgi:hypothetical protein